MPRYFTHVLNHTGYVVDTEGQEFENLSEALSSARETAVSILVDEIWSGERDVRIELHIVDEAGERLATLPVSAIVTGLDAA